VDDIVDNLGSREHPGHPVVIPEGSVDSKRL